jgi:hypothetical protein
MFALTVEVSRSLLSGTRLVSMLIVNGSSSNVTDILPLDVLEMPKSTVISPRFSSCFNVDG